MKIVLLMAAALLLPPMPRDAQRPLLDAAGVERTLVIRQVI